MLSLLEKITWIQYICVVFTGSVLGVLMFEILIRFNEGVKDAVEDLEKNDGAKKALIGVSVAVMPLLLNIIFHLIGIYEPMMEFFDEVKWPQYIFFACYLLGAVWLIRGLVTFVLAIRHG